MTSLAIREVPYRADSPMLFEALLDRAWPVFLDSGWPASRQGRFDVLSADPTRTLVTRGPCTELRGPGETTRSQADPFELLDQALGVPRSGSPDLPFCGGAIGYFGYDLARRLERLPTLALDGEDMPEMAVGIYDWALVVDHQRGRSHVVAQDEVMLDHYWGLLSRAATGSSRRRSPVGFRVIDPVGSNMSRDAYLGAVDRIKRYLLAGDCYQVNLAQRFSARSAGDPWAAYRMLRAQNPAPFGAYLGTAHGQVLCSSPERFLAVRSGRVETKPIKGTRPRGSSPIEDRKLAHELGQDAKERAENLMIVDLLRNDLGKVCEIGSIRVPQLFAIESFARVHHLVSTVTGRLAAGRTALDLLRACFPGGSITGAPKLRAMEIIEELEPHRRGVYCGAIGYIGYDGAMDTNIAIRTLVHSGEHTRLWAGGGIVADSNPQAELRETYHKAAPLLDVLERLRRAEPPT